jgi:hypothetical protein
VSSSFLKNVRFPNRRSRAYAARWRASTIVNNFR